MNHTDAIKTAIAGTEHTQQSIADKIGAKNRAVVSARINHENITVKALTELLDAFGYELTMQPKQEGFRPEGQYVLSREDYV